MLTINQVVIIDITRYDWLYPQSVYLQLQPILRPKSFTRRIRATVDTDSQRMADTLLNGHYAVVPLRLSGAMRSIPMEGR